MKELVSTVKEVKKTADNTYALTVVLPESVGEIKGGQFLNIATGDNSRLLKRPFGMVRAQGNEITVCFQVKGDGTKALANVKNGEKLNVLLPLGNGFNIPETAKNIVVIGGGVGIFPLVPVINGGKEKKFYSYIGFRNKDCACLLNEFEKSEKLTVVTDDGSLGAKDNAVNAYFADIGNVPADLIIACGPPVMLRALKKKLVENGVKTPCLVSLEERMGCGIGACLVCVCKKADGSNARVCKDGPVFDINEVCLD
ncbi:MAG: dihydroorotate dehydrogenase electron transfer subunit [Roseburia sp.]|nr:dihydroorotate dehydrogenase electron transfer subunit [Roseburia sp.]